MADLDKLRSIFIVEDDPDIQIISRMCLEEIGEYDVSIFECGTSLFRELETRLPQLILLDVMLPVMDGPTILKKLRDEPKTRDLPVIFMTAKVRMNDFKVYDSLGVLGTIGKPFDPVTMVQTVEQLWAR
ncbi:hypothetical protein Q669_31960 [Labrenzia sp. C1B10]|uniref:response regulator n=1 Tax=unclassified Labrenzia TaxID=2648686 RepID=UPI0003B808ED|nr:MULTISPECIES: response regulator [unclassified Labrenzia]ERP92519.1 hypothetical protein Q669_31960 [Labrenzia sp. C1B10]ERS04003.1 hypothetical protein Q675_30985 [Labrenzia sp. C1B70]